MMVLVNAESRGKGAENDLCCASPRDLSVDELVEQSQVVAVGAETIMVVESEG